MDSPHPGTEGKGVKECVELHRDLVSALKVYQLKFFVANYGNSLCLTEVY